MVKETILDYVDIETKRLHTERVSDSCEVYRAWYQSDGWRASVYYLRELIHPQSANRWNVYTKDGRKFVASFETKEQAFKFADLCS